MTRNGKPLSGQAVNDHKFQSVSSLDELEDYGLKRPTFVEGATKRDKDLVAASRVRKDLNRAFDQPRRVRAEVYSGYIENVEVNGHPGGTPAITIYHELSLLVADGDLLVPYSAVLTALDGETQTEARYILRERNPATGGNLFAITVYHGLPYSHAMQLVHDYNAYVNPISEARLASFNQDGALTRAILIAAAANNLELGIHINKRSPKPSKHQVLSLLQLIRLAGGFQLNGAAMKSNLNNGQIKEMNLAGKPDLPPAAQQGIHDAINLARVNATVRMAPLAVWQVAGAKLAENAPLTSLNWVAGVNAYNATATGTRGGLRTPIKDRLAAIYRSM